MLYLKYEFVGMFVFLCFNTVYMIQTSLKITYIINLRSNEMSHQDFQLENVIEFWSALTSVMCIQGKCNF